MRYLCTLQGYLLVWRSIGMYGNGREDRTRDCVVACIARLTMER
jgi:hypothetical protein